MYKSVIFVDFENIQRLDESLIDSKTKIIVMVGLCQNNKAFEFARNLFNKVSSIELIKVNGRGPNALDIFIAFYIGRYFESIKESEIIICSNDSDYDQLIKHLDGYGISIKRTGLSENVIKQIIEAKKPGKKKARIKAETETDTDDTIKIIEYLRKQTESQKNKRPKKITTLENYLYAHFSQKIQIDEIKKAIETMKANNNLIITNNKVNYNDI
ncbi:MAG: hypothetical protein LBB28_02320 [Synergistaceae bacterium]|jgi:hypothetical protein|nr:hypothetical protein [Synergistaceae bacterium]